MTAIVGNAGALKVNGYAVAELRNWTLELTTDTIETTNMGDATRQYVKGIASWSGSADAYFDPQHFAATGSSGNNIDGLIFGSVGDSAVAVALYPEGDITAGSDKIISGSIIVTGYSITGSFDGMIEASISFQGTGAPTYATTG